MHRTTSRLARRAALAAACTGMTLAGMIIPGLASAAPKVSIQPPVVAGSTYLALGDSVTFGYREADTSPKPDYTKASDFNGYPELLRDDMGLRVTNLACPGETSGSFISVTAVSNGCETTYTGGPGYRDAYPLHKAYTGAQLARAEQFLENNPQTRLVSLMIGANDGFVCQETTKDGCIKELPKVLKQIEKNVTTILTGLRDTAGYTGQLVIVNYYSTDYANVLDNAESNYLNEAVDGAAQPFDVEIADGYAAFENASVHSGRNTCTAGLLTQLTGAAKGTCGVHPSAAGAALLALTVEKAVTK